MSKPQLSIKVDQDIKPTFKQLDKGEHRYFLCELDKDGNSLNLIKTSSKDATFEDFVSEFKDDHCAIAVYKFEFDVKDIGKRDKNLIVTWIPMKANVKSRMIQAGGVGLVKRECDGIAVIHQAGTKEDLSEEIFMEKVQKFLRF